MYQEKIAALRKKLDDIETEIENLNRIRQVAQPSSPTCRHNKPWLEFEKELLKEELGTLASKLARQFGRSDISILLHIHTYISRGMKDA